MDIREHTETQLDSLGAALERERVDLKMRAQSVQDERDRRHVMAALRNADPSGRVIRALAIKSEEALGAGAGAGAGPRS